MSRHNLISPEALVQTLRLMANSPTASFYRASLAVAGESGTLKNRFITPNRVILQTKTGILSGVSALSGYVEVPGSVPGWCLALLSINRICLLQKCDRRSTKLCYY